MPTQQLMERLRTGQVLLLDGATGSELQRRGVNVSQGASPDGTPAEGAGVWSGAANLEAPEVVRQIHADYLQLGVDMIISNNFWTSRPRLASIGQAERWEAYTRAGGELAVQTRNQFNPAAYVAGGVAPATGGDLGQEYRDQARVLAAVGVDVMLAEFLTSIDLALLAADALATVGLPVWLGMARLTPDGTLANGERLEDLARALHGRRVDAMLLMCSAPEAISAGLPRLRAAFAGPIGGYANLGYERNPAFGTAPEEPYWRFADAAYTPAGYAAFGRTWQHLGAQIVGGCCGSGPAHIAALRPVVKGEAGPQPP